MRLSSFKKYKTPSNLDELFADDPFGLLNDVGEKRLKMSVSDKVRAQFDEVAAFIKDNNKMPSPDSDDFDEVLLYERYATLIKEFPEGDAYCQSVLDELNAVDDAGADISDSTEDDPACSYLSDENSALKNSIDMMQHRSYTSIDDIFSDDPLGLLTDVGDSPVERENWKNNVKNEPEEKTRQTVCKEFFKYQRYFEEINRLLAEGQLKTKDIVGDSASIGFGDIFIVDGVMSLIADVYEETDRASSDKSKRQYRVHQILSSGKEARPWSTTIKTSFYKANGVCSRVVYAGTKGYEFLTEMRQELERASEGSVNSIMAGYIYILQSKSRHKEIIKFTQSSSLVKIGFCTTTVEQRIANAANEPTYLCAPVKILKSYKCYNFDPRNLEDVLHTILNEHRLNLELTDKGGKKYKPREWFTVSVRTASDIVEHLFAGDIADYYVDSVQGMLKRKHS